MENLDGKFIALRLVLAGNTVRLMCGNVVLQEYGISEYMRLAGKCHREVRES